MHSAVVLECGEKTRDPRVGETAFEGIEPPPGYCTSGFLHDSRIGLRPVLCLQYEELLHREPLQGIAWLTESWRGVQFVRAFLLLFSKRKSRNLVQRGAGQRRGLAK